MFISFQRIHDEIPNNNSNHNNNNNEVLFHIKIKENLIKMKQESI